MSRFLPPTEPVGSGPLKPSGVTPTNTKMSEFNYWVASESRKRQADSGLRAGRLSAQPGALVPSGTTHAVNDRDEVACGRPLNGLLRFSDFSWDSIEPNGKCSKCRTAVGH